MSDYSPGMDGTCPHCLREVNFKRPGQAVIAFGNAQQVVEPNYLGVNWREQTTQRWMLITSCLCPSCGKPILSLDISSPDDVKSRLVYPRGSALRAPPEVPDNIAKDYNEAVLVLGISLNASAALARRCLEQVLIHQGYNQGKLSKKVEAVLPTLPTYIRETLDAVREVGNFAAHPIEDENSGLILDVNPAEAELVIMVLHQLFDHYYVKPEEQRRRIEALNGKLKSAGRDPLKK